MIVIARVVSEEIQSRLQKIAVLFVYLFQTDQPYHDEIRGIFRLKIVKLTIRFYEDDDFHVSSGVVVMII